MTMKLDKMMVAGCAVAAAVSFACGNNDRRAATASPAATGGAPDTAADSRPSDKPAITLTGCVQKTDGITGEYILTQANPGDANSPVATSGSVEQKETRAAEHSYRLDGETSQLGDLVGHRVRVNGNLEERGDVAKKDADARRTADGRHAGDRELKASDLAKVEVRSVANVADTCGGTKTAKAKAGAASKSKR